MIIYKHPIIDANKWIQLALPINSKILMFQSQFNGLSNIPHIWYSFDQKNLNNLETREFIAIGTGVEFNAENCIHLQSTQSGSFIWHLFEKVKKDFI